MVQVAKWSSVCSKKHANNVLRLSCLASWADAQDSIPLLCILKVQHFSTSNLSTVILPLLSQPNLFFVSILYFRKKNNTLHLVSQDIFFAFFACCIFTTTTFFAFWFVAFNLIVVVSSSSLFSTYVDGYSIYVVF